MDKQVLRTGLVVTALAAATALSWTTGAPPAHAEPECTNGSNDFNSDNFPDLAYGAPGENDDRGSVTVRFADENGWYQNVLVRPDDLQPGDEFGASVAEVAYFEDELDTGACTQLVVGAPGRDVDGKNDVGSVFVFTWNSSDERFHVAKELVPGKDAVPGGPRANARFGSTLASPYHEPGIGSIVRPLYIGAPGDTVDGQEGAGAVAQVRLTGSSDAPEVGKGTLFTQGSNGIPGTPEAGDAFGASVAALDNGMLAGAPGENDKAGGVVRWRENDSGAAKFLTQNSSGVPGTSEAGDEFGAVVYAALETRDTPGGAYDVMVGAPGEAIGSVKRAGSAIRFVYHGDVEMAKTKGYNQNTAGVAGTAETGDRFGSSFGSFGPDHILVGAPGEGVGDKARAGLVLSLTGSQSWHQGTPGVHGYLEAGDMFGATMGNALVPMTGEREDGWLSSIAIGLAGEDDNAGSILLGLPGGSGDTSYLSGGQAGDRIGAALGKTN